MDFLSTISLWDVCWLIWILALPIIALGSYLSSLSKKDPPGD